MCPFELSATPDTSPRLKPSGSFSGFEASNGISGCASKVAPKVSAASKIFISRILHPNPIGRGDVDELSGRRFVNRIGHTRNRPRSTLLQVQHNHLVRSLLQPRRRQEQTLLRT